MTSFDHQFFDSDYRVSRSLSNDRCQNILYKAVFEHFKKIKDVAVLLLTSKSFQNSTFGANFLVNFAIDDSTIQLLESVLSPSSCFSMQFVPSLHIFFWTGSAEKADQSISNFFHEKYLHLSLRSLILDGVGDEVLSNFFGSSTNSWPQLQNLKVKRCAVNDTILEVICKNAIQLRTLRLAGDLWITDDGVAHIYNLLTNITSLKLSGCRMITDASVELLTSQLTSITCFDLGGCVKISDPSLHSICTNLVGITSLNLASCNRITDVGIEHISKLAGITVLDLSWCPSITDAGIVHVSKLSHITSLWLSNCHRITDAGLGHLSKLSHITSLRLSSCNITDVGLAWISNLSRITFLDLNRCDKITDAGLDLISKLTGITSLDLAFCKTITDAGIEHVSRLANITSLNLEYCYITEISFEHIVKLPNITTLRLTHRNKISMRAKLKLVAALPNCSILFQ